MIPARDFAKIAAGSWPKARSEASLAAKRFANGANSRFRPILDDLFPHRDRLIGRGQRNAVDGKLPGRMRSFMRTVLVSTVIIVALMAKSS